MTHHIIYVSEPSEKPQNGSLRDPVISGIAQTIATRALTAFHEFSHAMTAMALYENADPKIEVSLFGGGNTTFWNHRPRAATLKWLGKAHASSAVAAAGPITDIFALLAITKLSRSNQQIARILSMKALSLSVYALSACFFCFPGHDFCTVWSNSGILPYGILTASCLATTAIVMRIAWLKNPATHKAARVFNSKSSGFDLNYGQKHLGNKILQLA